MAAKRKQPRLMNKGINFYLLALAFILAIGIMASTRYMPQKHIVRVVDDTQEIESVYFDKNTRVYSSPEIVKPSKEGKNEPTDITYKFSIQIPEGWKLINEDYSGRYGGYRLTLTKDEYRLSIRDALGIPDVCVFDSYDLGGVDEQHRAILHFPERIEVRNNYETLRFGTGYVTAHRESDAADQESFTSCKYNSTTDEWETGTSVIGSITLYAPFGYKDEIVQEALSIISNLIYKKIK